MIDVQSITRCYGSFTAVNNVSFKVGSNEIVGLLGHNGAGKTTIIKMLSGYLEPSQGRIVIAGIELASNARAVQRQLGYLPESSPLYPDMLVADYLDYVATLKGIPWRERLDAVRDAIAATDLQEKATASIGTLSRGLKQRVGVAQAIIGKPRLLILDEPTSGLDPQQTLKMRALIKKLAENATIILSTHIMQEVNAICDRVLMLRSGHLILDELQDDLRNSRSLLLKIDTGHHALEKVLKRLPQIAQFTVSAKTAEYSEYTLTLHENADLDTAANNIAQSVIKSDAKLYTLQPLIRDLDTVFREANLAGANRHGD
ncbi:MAG: ABC-2 type transport system ATP-binding protein [Halioglobus sp.]|jgi:ABC-2 type transport system ATP-binding protein